MANNVKSVICMNGISTIPYFSIDKEKNIYLDFNKIIPMPADLYVTDGSIVSEALIYYLTDCCTKRYSDLNGKVSDILKPYIEPPYMGPEWKYELYARAFKNGEDDNLYMRGAQYYHNICHYGYPTWYGWRIEHWGTKWNSYDNKIINRNKIIIYTANSSPIPIIKCLSTLYPEKEIMVDYHCPEAGMSRGYMKIINGLLIEEIYEEDIK